MAYLLKSFPDHIQLVLAENNRINAYGIYVIVCKLRKIYCLKININTNSIDCAYKSKIFNVFVLRQAEKCFQAKIFGKKFIFKFKGYSFQFLTSAVFWGRGLV